MQYIPTLQNAYDEYRRLTPLDLGGDKTGRLDVWKDIIQYTLPEYARKVAILARAPSLDDFVRKSGGDFDNLAPLIKASIDNSLIAISPDGTISSGRSLSKTSTPRVSNDALVPFAEYNQFPCDNESSNYRADFILNRYPYRKSLHIGLIGDDDFISLRFMKDPTVKVSVVEKDTRIIKEIGSYEGVEHSVDVYELDIRDKAPDAGLDTFVTDPPYTFDGSLAFIICGLSMMGSAAKDKEFYVILNPTMMGRRWARLVEVLAEQGIVLTGIQEGVSNYRLPEDFAERRRANDFLHTIGVNDDALSYSSNSTMYTFSITDEINLDGLRANVKDDNIYEHYT